jgi:hypothetical protein
MNWPHDGQPFDVVWTSAIIPLGVKVALADGVMVKSAMKVKSAAIKLRMGIVLRSVDILIHERANDFDHCLIGLNTSGFKEPR